MPEPAVDVLVTVFNGEVHLQIALDSILSQTFGDFKLHIVDDGSTDRTPAILADYVKRDRRVRVYTKPNGGVVEASNFGLQHCQAEFVARFDADDISYPDRLERQVRLLRDTPNLLAVSGHAHKIDVNGRRLRDDAMSSSPADADADATPAREPYILHPFLMVRREALMRVGGYRPLLVAEDSDLYWRLIEIGDILNDQHFYGEYRMNPLSLSSRSVSFGRIMSAYSQLAALSARRRRAGEKDVDFTPELAERIRSSSGSLQQLCEALAIDVRPEELEPFKGAVGVKLMEMASYRPYELELSDCVFLAELYPSMLERLDAANRGFVVRSYSGAAARLAAHGLWDEARALCAGDLAPPFWFRYALRRAMGEDTRARIRDAMSPLLRAVRRA